MRVACLYDIHGNLPALEAVLDEARREGVDAVLVGGDVFPGPMARECLALLRSVERPVHWVMGNGDREVVAAWHGTPSPTLPARALEAITWCAGTIAEAEAAFIASWPVTTRLDVPGVGTVLACHATPENDVDIVLDDTPDAVMRSRFDGRADLVTCGHTHMPFDRVVGRTRVVNAGSVGMPFGEPGADWLLLGPTVQQRHTAYDLQAAAARIRATAYPQAAAFAEGNVLAPPSRPAMHAALSRSALGGERSPG